MATSEILVLTIGMDARKQAVFRMAFKMYAKAAYRLLESGEKLPPHLAIVDVDNVDGRALWSQFRANYPQLPALIVSAAPVVNAPAPVLQKPIRMETLFPYLEDLRSGKHGISAAPLERPMLVEEKQAEAPAQEAPQRQRPTFELLTQEIQYFDPQAGLVGLLKMVKRDKIPATVTNAIGQSLMLVDPGENEVNLLVDHADLIKIIADSSQQFRARSPQPRDEEHMLKRMTLDATLWQAAIWSADGRLMKNCRPNTPLQLKYWPNLTRLAPIPNALRIAAFLTRSPVNPLLTVKMLQIAPADLFNFLAAADSLDLLQSGATERPAGEARPMVRPPLGVPNTVAATSAPSPQRGFLSRLLRKIAGI